MRFPLPQALKVLGSIRPTRIYKYEPSSCNFKCSLVLSEAVITWVHNIASMSPHGLQREKIEKAIARPHSLSPRKKTSQDRYPRSLSDGSYRIFFFYRRKAFAPYCLQVTVTTAKTARGLQKSSQPSGYCPISTEIRTQDGSLNIHTSRQQRQFHKRSRFEEHLHLYLILTVSQMLPKLCS